MSGRGHVVADGTGNHSRSACGAVPAGRTHHVAGAAGSGPVRGGGASGAVVPGSALSSVDAEAGGGAVVARGAGDAVCKSVHASPRIVGACGAAGRCCASAGGAVHAHWTGSGRGGP